MDDKRRLIIIIFSVIIGTLMGAGLFIMRYGTISAENTGSLIFNLIFAFAIIFFIGVIFRKKN